jgi:hypothetical protein
MFKKSLLAIAAATATAQAQPTEAPAPAPAPAPMPAAAGGDAFQKGTMGVTFALDLDSALGSMTLGERVPTIGFAYFLDDKSALRLTAGLNVHKEQTTNNATPPMTSDTTVVGFALGAGYRMYKPVKVGRVHPYLEPAARFAWPDTSQSSTVLLGIGAQLGVECELADWFSLSGGLGGALDFTNSFKDIHFATASTLAANLYWH